MAKQAAPLWAQEFFLRCLSWAEEQDYQLPPLGLEWRRHHPRQRVLQDGHSYTLNALSSFSAHALRGLVRVIEGPGAKRGRLKMMIAHEVAHHIVGLGKGHSPLFWDTAWRLFRAMRLPIRETLKAEGVYRRGAVASYQRSKKAQGR